MYHTIKTEPNNEYSPPPIRQFLIKEELIDNSYSLSIPKNTVEQEAIDKRLESEIRNESVKEESIREPLRSLMSETARTEEHFSPENVHIHYQTQNNLVMSSFDRFFPTQVPEITIKQEPISENLQLRTREEDHVVKKMYQTVEIDSNHEYSLPPLRQSLIKEELIDDSYSFSITERTVNRMVKSKYQTQSNLTIPSFNGLLPTQTTELTIKQESTSEKWQRAQPEENGDDDNIVEEWDASTELDQFPTSENIDSEEATVPQKASNDSTRESFTQWSPEWDSLIMDEFFECIKRTNRPGFKNIAEAFLKKHKVGICLHTAVVCFKRVFQKRLRDPNVPEEEKTRMLKATKSWKMTKRYQEERPNERIRNTTKTSVGTIQWSNSWNKIIMDEFMKLAMDGSLDVFSVSKFCGKFKDEHDLAIAVSRLVMNFKQAFNDRLNDVHVELESKLKMLLKYKTKVPLELTKL
ncbi:hypothetical protein B9Z55_023974 [Caenorhabditis nigoni]|uniref:SPK domain-containing protein n=1 Tax=Caenorhabditis nigoni TaxID=1611254 RepID=A0A2G5SRZ0_9PELO|nr:hypothetical protein B9Z55_023974 [Caenorhabditis nigoni]